MWYYFKIIIIPVELFSFGGRIIVDGLEFRTIVLSMTSGDLFNGGDLSDVFVSPGQLINRGRTDLCSVSVKSSK